MKPRYVEMPRVFSNVPGLISKIRIIGDEPNSVSNPTVSRRTPERLQRYAANSQNPHWLARAAHRVALNEKPHVIRINGRWYRLELMGWHRGVQSDDERA